MRYILSPVDFSETSALALRYAAYLARCGGAKLGVLYADSFEAPPYFTHGQLADLEQAFRSARLQAEDALRDFARATLGEDAGFETRVVEAPAVEAIKTAAAETGADLIVMGTHGRSGFNRLMLGSVAERVLRESAIPVLTVRRGALPVRNILCPVNGSPAAEKALATAADLASCLGAKLTVLRVREPGAPEIPADPRELIREGDAAREILSLASEQGCDLLVIGAQHRAFFDATVLGATAARLVRHAPCPVLTVVSAESARPSRAETEEATHVV